ncbi:hypothetical protein AALP_AA6G037900 [Arabis alpina]|uniref:F-box domain-containing protein n=1 Tax=Arabis alpina TaxID=50452 RepID=A0A087GLX9_ARAAL|nr:hypothetical protein AALP_AA6G037900 [Arabis alpina]
MDSPIPNENPNSLTTTVPSSNHSHADLIISSLLSFPDSSPISIGSSFDRVLDKSLASASSNISDQDRLVDRTLELASLLLDSTKRCFRKRASVHNSNSWFLPQELTIKVFSMLDTKSLMQASASCTMFNKCAMDRLCYSNIDLTTSAKHADNGVVCTMIHRAGKELRSLKLGRVVRPVGSDSTASLLTGSCLSPLSYNHGFVGSRLRSLRLYNLRPMNCKSLCDALSVCSNITDLRIVGLYILSEQLFKTLATKCRFIENLFLEAYGCQCTLDTKTGSALVEFVTNCPNLSSLTLIRFGLNGQMSRNLAESSRKLKYMNLSRSPTIKGRFLRDLGVSCKDGPLKTLILRNCPALEEKDVLEFCNSLITGDFKSIQHIDVSNNRGLASAGGKRSYKPNFPLEKLKEERPGVNFVADFSVTSSEKLSRVYDEEELRLIEMMEAKDDGDDDDESEDEDSEDDDGFEDDDSDEEIYGDHFLL